MSDLLSLKAKNPLVGSFLENWLSEFGNRTFSFETEKDQNDFYAAIEKMVKHVIHTSPSSNVSILFDDTKGVQTVFIHVN